MLVLASDLASFITGQTLFVDGGWTIHWNTLGPLRPLGERREAWIFPTAGCSIGLTSGASFWNAR